MNKWMQNEIYLLRWSGSSAERVHDSVLLWAHYSEAYLHKFESFVKLEELPLTEDRG